MANKIYLGNIIGATGERGEQGVAGQNGADGLTPYISNGFWWIGTTNTNVLAKGNTWFAGSELPSGQGNDGDLFLKTNGEVYKKVNGVWSLVTTLRGEQGEQGERGETALTVRVGNVTTTEAGTEASVTNSGTDVDLVLDFTIPRGERGEQGEQGRDGNTTVYVAGLSVPSVSFEKDPQTQINEKLSKNFGLENAGKTLKVDEDGFVVAGTGSGAEVDNEFNLSSEKPLTNSIITRNIVVRKSGEDLADLYGSQTSIFADMNAVCICTSTFSIFTEGHIYKVYNQTNEAGNVVLVREIGVTDEKIEHTETFEGLQWNEVDTVINNIEPFKYEAIATIEQTLTNKTEVSLGNSVVELAKYGLVIGEISGQEVYLYAITIPDVDIVIKLEV